MTRGRSIAGTLAVALLLCAPVALAQRDFGRTTIRIPDATTAGNWYGTWVFENRARKIALWVRDGDDGPQIRLKQLMLDTAESFGTAWDGTASYDFPGVEGEVRIAIDESDANGIRGSWHWRSTHDELSVTERGRFTLFRAGDGRFAVMQFDEFEIENDNAGQLKIQRPPRVWSFRKASRRLAEWDELAF